MKPNSPPLPHADFERWISESWQTEERYYQADIIQDLFGTWLLKRSWGGLGSRLGNSKTVAARDYEHAMQLLDAVAKERERRGYHLLCCPMSAADFTCISLCNRLHIVAIAKR